MTDFLVLINSTLVFLFGFFLTVSFSGGCFSRKERHIVGILCTSLFVAQVVCLKIFGFTAAWQFYPLISHVPIILTLVFGLKKPLGVAIVSMFTGYFCCQLPRWVSTIFLDTYGTQTAYQISYCLAIPPIFYILNKHFAAPAHKAMSYSKSSLLIFGALPMSYYLFDYVTRVYTSALYEGLHMISEFLPAIMALFYILFVTVYHNEVQRRNETELQNSMLAMEFEQAKNDIFTLQQIQEKTAAYRHDMRHHFTMISGYLETGEVEKASQYIKLAKNDIEQITPKRYCQNTAVNLVLSAFSDKAERLGVTLKIEANIPNTLPIPETALCTLFSNGLENAVNAASKLSDRSQKIVRVNCQIHKENLLVFISNQCEGEILFHNNLPRTGCPGHGFGVKSIKMIADMHGGYCSFEAKGNTFTLKVVLPLRHE